MTCASYLVCPCYGRRKPTGKPRSRWEDAVWRDTVDFLQIQNWKAAERKRESRMKVIGEVMARRWAETP